MESTVIIALVHLGLGSQQGLHYLQVPIRRRPRAVESDRYQCSCSPRPWQPAGSSLPPGAHSPGAPQGAVESNRMYRSCSPRPSQPAGSSLPPGAHFSGGGHQCSCPPRPWQWRVFTAYRIRRRHAVECSCSPSPCLSPKCTAPPSSTPSAMPNVECCHLSRPWPRFSQHST